MSHPTPPRAARKPTLHEHHGEQRPDEHHWLKIQGRADPEVLAYLEAENVYLDAVMSPLRRLQEELYSELLSHVQERDEQPPVVEGEWLYFTRSEEGQAHPLYLRRSRAGGPEEALLDLNQLKAQEGHTNVWVHFLRPSPDGERFAYLLDTSGQEVFELRVALSRSGELVEPPLTGVSGGSLAWSQDGTRLYYLREDPTQRPYQLWRHTLNSPQAEDELLFQEDDPTFRVAASRSHSGAWILMDSSASLSTEWHALDAGDPQARPAVVVPRQAGIEYTLQDADDHWLALTNAGGASEFRLVRLPRGKDLSWDNAQDILSYHPQRLLEGMQVFAGHLLLAGREGGVTRLWVLARTTEGYGLARRLEFPETSYTVRIGANREYGAEVAHILYTSLVQPTQHLDLDLNTLRTSLIQATPVPGYNADQYVAEVLWADAPDGERVPISTVRRRDTTLPAPTLLYGYGSYGIPMDPEFRPDRLPLLDRGWVWAIAHIRGGSELGRRWYDGGRLDHKMNTFTDFIAAGEALLREGYTRRDALLAMGRSAGGLLMGAVINLRPDLFRAVFVGVPFVDVVSTMLDASIPLTTNEYDEWGNPEQEHWYRVTRAYSPYDNLEKAVYPHLFVSTGLNDPRVAYWEPAKYVARLRTLARQGSGELVLKTQFGAGHGGSSGRYEALQEVAEEYAFALAAVDSRLDRGQ